MTGICYFLIFYQSGVWCTISPSSLFDPATLTRHSLSPQTKPKYAIPIIEWEIYNRELGDSKLKDSTRYFMFVSVDYAKLGFVGNNQFTKCLSHHHKFIIAASRYSVKYLRNKIVQPSMHSFSYSRFEDSRYQMFLTDCLCHWRLTLTASFSCSANGLPAFQN